MTMANLIFPDYQGSFNQGYKNGQQIQFNRIAGQAVAAQDPNQRASLLAQSAQFNPGGAIQLDNALQDQEASAEQRRNATLVNMSKLLVSAPEQYKNQVYQKIKPSLQQLGLSQVPDQYDETVAKTAQSIVDAYTPNSTSSSLREFQSMTQGLSPADVERAKRINLGLDARAVTGAAKQGTFRGSDGRERPYVFDPATRTYSVFNGQQWVPLGAQEAAQIDASAGAPAQASSPRKSIEQIQAEATQMANQGGPGANAAAAEQYLVREAQANGYDLGGAPQAQPPQQAQTNMLGVGRSPEDQAFATESAQQQAQLAALPQSEAIKTNFAIQQAQGTAQATNQAKVQSETQQQMQKRQRDANDLIGLLDQAESILPQATGSRGGATLDALASTVGKSTEGARATARLKTIAGQAIAKIPRMEGPQSDADVRLYRESAGDLANDNIPYETRLAALQQLRALQQKYAGGGNQIQTSSSVVNGPSSDNRFSGFSIKRVGD